MVYSSQNGEEEFMEITKENSDAKEFLQVKNRQPDEDREASKNRFHEFVMPKGGFCTRCHSGEEKSDLLFRTLFFSEQRIYHVTNLNIVGIVENTGNSTCPYYSNSSLHCLIQTS